MAPENILITSSDNFSSSEINYQHGIVDSQIVVGANLFRDVFSSFRDIFGGETKGYKKDINKMKKAALDNLKEQAIGYGANAIISLRLDLDEVSGGGKSMFMINAYGSAVELEDSAYRQEEDDTSLSEFTIEDIDYYKRKNRLQKKISEADEVGKEISYDSISEFDLWNEEVSLSVLKHSKKKKYHELQHLEDNIANIPSRYIEEYLVEHIHQPSLKYWDTICEDLNERNWFNYEFLLDLLKQDNHVKRFRGLRLCTIEKDYYSKNEISDLKRIGKFLKSEFDTSVDTKTVDKMIGSKEIFTCPYGLRDREPNRCECGRNKFGLSKTTPESIASYLINTAHAMESAVKDLE